MTKSGAEPARLRWGKEFHRTVQEDWAGVSGAVPEAAIRDMRGRRRRMDIFVDEADDWVSVIEIKRTDWDAMRPHRVRPNALRHARQLWAYVEPFLEPLGRDVCPGIIYERVPTTPGRLEEVEAVLHERGVQVVWWRESVGCARVTLLLTASRKAKLPQPIWVHSLLGRPRRVKAGTQLQASRSSFGRADIAYPVGKHAD